MAFETVKGPGGSTLGAYVPGQGWVADQNWTDDFGGKLWNTNLAEQSNADYAKQRDAQIAGGGGYVLGSATPFYNNVDSSVLDGLTPEQRAVFNMQGGAQSGGLTKWGSPTDPNVGRPTPMARDKFVDKDISPMDLAPAFALAGGPLLSALGAFGAAGGAMAGAEAAGGAMDMGIGGIGESMGLSGSWGVNPMNGGGMNWLNDIIEQSGNFTGGELPVGGADPIGSLVNNLNSGMSSADAIKAVEASIPGSTQTTLQFLMNNPSQLLSMGLSPQNALKLLQGGNGGIDIGKLLGAGLGAIGSNNQANTLRGIADQAKADRQPFLDASLGWLRNPDSYFAGPGKAAMDGVLRGLSVNGNPAGVPTSQATATEAGLRDWRSAVTGFGNLGLAGQDTRAQLQSNAAGADVNTFHALGSGLNTVLNPQPSLEDLVAALKIGGLS